MKERIEKRIIEVRKLYEKADPYNQNILRGALKELKWVLSLFPKISDCKCNHEKGFCNGSCLQQKKVSDDNGVIFP